MAQNSVATTLVSGIQDISAFLPIIGTEQCEKHIGSALDGGFMYAAATPLSMFGSLGIIKASIAVLCASIHSEGAQMLSDAGFKLEGSAAAMIGKVPRGEKEKRKDKEEEKEGRTPYVAARQFLELLKEQHIENDASKLSLEFTYFQWNISLIIMTILLLPLSITPYIPIIVENHGITVWIYPLLRIIGSAICVITVQLIIQIRTKTILNDVLKKLTEESGGKDVQTSSQNDEPSKTSEITESDSRKVPDPEKGPVASQDPPRETTSGSSQDPVQERSAEAPVLNDHNHSEPPVKAKLLSLLPAKFKITFTRFYLTFLQFCLFLGIGATGVGYIGCFTVIQNAASKNNTYLWVGLEAILAFIRIILWGSNPKWDEATGIKVDIALEKTSPLVTTPMPYDHHGVDESKSFERLMVVDDLRFLNHLTPYTGPLERFNGSDHNVAIYYTLVGKDQTNSKVLLTTVLDLKTRSAFVLEHQSGSANPEPHVYSASFEVLQETGISVVTFKTTDTLDKLQQSKRKDLVHSIEKHSRQLIVHIAGGEKHVGEDRKDRVSHLYLSWTISHQNTSNPPILQSSPLSQIALCICQFLDALLHHPASPTSAPTTEPQPQIAVLTDADKQYLDWNKNVCQAKIEACDHSAEVYKTVMEAWAEEMMADLAGDPVPEQHAKNFTYTCSFVEMLAHCESAVLEAWVLLEYQKLASNIPMHSDIFADAWSVRLTNRCKGWRDGADMRISEYKKLPLISPDDLMPQFIQHLIERFVGSIHVDDYHITLPDTNDVAQQLQDLSQDKSLDVFESMKMFMKIFMDMFTMSMSGEDIYMLYISMDMLSGDNTDIYRLFSHQKHEMAQMIDRVMHVFQEGINLENQPSMKLALAEYVMYPEKGSERDGVALMQIMLRRQLTVYDCKGMSDGLIDFLPQLGDVPGASLIKVAPAWEDQVVSFIETHPTIPIFSITLVDDVDDDESISEPLQHLLQRNRLSWAEQCDNGKADVTSFLCFGSNFIPYRAFMLCYKGDGHAILMVHVAKAGALQLTFLHRAMYGDAVLSLSLLTFGLDFTSLSPGKTTPLPQLKIKPSDGFRRDTVEIMVEAGYYEISIDVEAPSFYNLRRITAAFATGSDKNPGQGSSTNDEISEEEDSKSED